MKRFHIAATILAGSLATVTHGAFVSMNFVSSTVILGADTFYVFKLYAKFDNTNDTVLNADFMNALPAGIF